MQRSLISHAKTEISSWSVLDLTCKCLRCWQYYPTPALVDCIITLFFLGNGNQLSMSMLHATREKQKQQMNLCMDGCTEALLRMIGFNFLVPMQIFTPGHVIGKTEISINLFWDTE